MMRVFALVLATVCSAAAPGLAQSRAAKLTKPIEYYNPDWSPDGRAIVFESTLDGKYSIYAINGDGTGLRRLTVDTANSEQATWSPDGRRIVFSSDRDGHSDLYLMNADGSNQTRLTTTTSGGYYQSSFSPDGRWIVFQGRPDNSETRDRVYIVASDGTGLRQLTDSSYGAEGPRWSRDGKAITFRQVPYPKRLWSEMGDGDMAVAQRGSRVVTMRPDGSGLAPVMNIAAGDSRVTWTRDGTKGFFTSSRDGLLAVYEVTRAGGRDAAHRVADAAVVVNQNVSPDGRRFAYTKLVDGWSGLYVYDIDSRSERLLTGGPGAGPVGYLRTARLTAGTDTMDTYDSPKGSGQITRGNGAWLVRSMRQVAGRRWEVRETWFDSTGRETARQSVRTARGSLATELETVRAPSDSASMLVTADRVTGWVVPQGQPPQLFDAAASGERFTAGVVSVAIAMSKPAVGRVFEAPVASLYGGNPVTTRVDSIRVVRHDTLLRADTAVPVLVLEHAGGAQSWVDETTGTEWLSRGNAGPSRWWWHVRRGVRLPEIR